MKDVAVPDQAELILIPEPQAASAADLIDQLAEMANASDAEPVQIAAGTFALYPMRDGGMMFVTAVDHGLLAGIKHTRIPPGFIRAVSVLASGGSKFTALKMLAGGMRRPKEIGRGE